MAAVATTRRPDSACDSPPDRAPAALELLHQLLKTPQALPEAGVLLAQVATAFAAKGAGLLAFFEGTPEVLGHFGADGQQRFALRYPWEERPDLLEQSSTIHSARSARTADGSEWLLARAGAAENELHVFLESAGVRAWSAGEIAALALAGSVLLQCASAAAPWHKFLERARKHRALEQSAVVTSRLAHDFGNLLTGIMGFAELGLNQLPGDSLPRRYMAEVVQAGKKGTEWIGRLQLFSRRKAAEFLPCQLASVMGEEEARIRAAWQGKVALHIALASDLPAIAVDKDALRHVVGALLDNAREAIADQGVVTVSARVCQLGADACREILGQASPGTYVELIVIDTGSGLRSQVRQRLFLDAFLSSKPRHRGLGLATVYGILRTFHGGLQIGPQPSQGTALHIYLPVAARTGCAMSPGPTTRPAIIVVLEDSHRTRQALAILQHGGYRAQGAASALEAIQLHLAASEPFGALLADRDLAQSGGIDLVARLRETQPRLGVVLLNKGQEGLTISPTGPIRADALLALVGAAFSPAQSLPSPVGGPGTPKSS